MHRVQCCFKPTQSQGVRVSICGGWRLRRTEKRISCLLSPSVEKNQCSGVTLSCVSEGTFFWCESTISLSALGDSQWNWHSQSICFITVERPEWWSCQSGPILEFILRWLFPRQAAMSTFLCWWRQQTGNGVTWIWIANALIGICLHKPPSLGEYGNPLVQ